ncbi:uncharacterized protein LOC131146029 isoform X2 [Malania oleifera]|uniref:uncharacterized protein LOC131146029 isoform X2 n=1 Tax=Malania oleifera TaxID=397392 RepID=UPI0025AE81DB|nr:uncharacterized protein LOC131146029 isoform X2 [Malania oleifera]
MMDWGFFVNGGSSSSSSLSALAQPFRVDRSVNKPNSNPLVPLTEPPCAAPFNPSLHNLNPLVHLSEAPCVVPFNPSLHNSNPRMHLKEPPCGAPFNPSLQNWLYSHNPTSIPDFLAGTESEVDSLCAATCLPSPNPYRFSGSLSIHLPDNSLPPLNSSPMAATDEFSYAQSSDSLITSLIETEPYYPQYVPPAVHDNSPLAVLSEPGYDFLSTSHVARLSGSFQDDCTQSLSGLEHPAGWSGFWNGLADGKQGKQMNFDGSFSAKEINVAGSSIYKDFMKQGAPAVESLSRCEEVAAVSDRKYVNTQGRENCIGSPTTEQPYDKYSLGQNPKFIPVESSRAPVLGPTLIFPENHPQSSSLESVSNSFNHPKLYGALHEKSSPAIVIRPPSSGTSSSTTDKISSKNVNFIGNAVTDYSEDFAGSTPSNRKEPHHPVCYQGKEVREDTGQLSIGMERNDLIFVKSSALEKKEVSNTLVANNVLDQAISEHKVSQIDCSDNFQIGIGAEAADSTEKLSESLDYYNPAVDSPCWKGAPASKFSPFEVSEDATRQLLTKKIEACGDLNLPNPSIFPLNTNDGVKVSSKKVGGNTMYPGDECLQNGLSFSLKNSLISNQSREQRSHDAVKAGFQGQKLNSIQFPDYIHEPRKEFALHIKLKGDSDSRAHSLQPMLEEGNFACDNTISSGVGFSDAGMSSHDVSEGGSIQFQAAEYVPCLPCCGKNDPAKLVKPHKGEFSPKMNVQMIVNTVHNLSELLLFHCYNDDAYDLREHDRDALKNVIKNLDACMVKAEPMSSKQDATPQGVKETDVNVQGQVNCQHTQEEVKHYTMFDKKDGIIPLKDDLDVEKYNDMTKSIKKILHDNFHDEDETNPRTLLFKNAWLEAEAALCSVSYRARFDRMKIEMGKCNFLQPKENDVAGEKLLSSKASHDANMVENSSSEAKDSDVSIQDSLISSTDGHVDDVEASVMARLHILKCRDENSDSMSTGKQLLPEVVDLGFTGKENRQSLNRDRCENESLGLIVEPDLLCRTANYAEDKFGLLLQCSEPEAMKEFGVCSTDDQVIQSCGNSRPGKQLPGWYDNSSSEWEHVLKEELPWQN